MQGIPPAQLGIEANLYLSQEDLMEIPSMLAGQVDGVADSRGYSLCLIWDSSQLV